MSASQGEDWGEVPLPDKLKAGMRLYVGSLAAAENAAFMAEAEIKHVVTAAGRLKPDLPEPRPAHLCLNLADHPTANLLAELPAAFEFCDKASEKSAPSSSAPSCGVLIHCASGVSRSVSVCVAYLIARGGLSYEEALEAVKVNREQACPNLGFQQQLKILEQSNGNVAVALENWSQKAGEDVMGRALNERGAANSLHGRLDVLEDEIAVERSSALTSGGLTDEKRQSFIRNLDQLQEEINRAMGDFNDRPAKSILKAAAQKSARLIDSI
mmetsp:Transcript_4438/g.8017  ORF Transcript_4438/g.8017 Transcript_4438/m.8017 type:complete len:270 (-) Transcript_4438:179-988(-)